MLGADLKSLQQLYLHTGLTVLNATLARFKHLTLQVPSKTEVSHVDLQDISKYWQKDSSLLE
jgi:hypothetical protein